MSYHQRPHELRLAISAEAEALFSDFGGEAYAEACRRAREASSDSLARDWSVVAATIVRRSGRRSSARRLIRLNRRTLIRRQGAALNRRSQATRAARRPPFSFGRIGRVPLLITAI